MSTPNRSASLLFAAVAASVAATAVAIPESASDNGIWLGGTVNISPFIEGGYIHDDNPNGFRKQKSDLLAEQGIEKKSSDGYTIRPGFNVDIPGNCWRLAGRAYYSMVRYSEDDVDDRDDWGESLAFSGETDGGLAWRLDESIVKVDLEEQFIGEFPYNFSTRDRIEMTFGGSLSKRITEKCRLEVGGSYSKTDYDYEELYDYERYGGRLSFAHVLTEKTDWTATASHTIHKQTTNSDLMEDTNDDTSSTKFLLGVKSRSTERVTFDIQGGVEFYDGNASEDGASNDETSFTYAFGIHWQPTERLNIGLRGLGEYEPSEDIYGSSVDTKSVGLTASYRFFERLRVSAGINYRREEYERRISKITAANGNPYSVDDINGYSRDDDTLELSGRITYSLNNYASIYASVTYFDLNSSIDDFEYDRTRYGFGGIIRY
jgi:opacity protein-like surface antigen